jgi:hypothetical protein
MAAILTVDKVREFISDYPESNLLLDEEEFSNTFIELSMELAVSEYNAISPKTMVSVEGFPSLSLLMIGTLWQMYTGRAARMARNHLSYTDGGLQIPVEEKFEMYQSLAANYGAQFSATAFKLKASMNMEGGWGEIRSDEATFPTW